MTEDRPSREDLVRSLDEARALIDAIRRGEVDAVVGTDDVLLLRLAEAERQAAVHRARLRELSARLTVAEDIAALPGTLSHFHVDLPNSHELIFRYRTSETEVGAILGAVAAAGLTVTDLSTEEPDLEDVFLELTRAQP